MTLVPSPPCLLSLLPLPQPPVCRYVSQGLQRIRDLPASVCQVLCEVRRSSWHWVRHKDLLNREVWNQHGLQPFSLFLFFPFPSSLCSFFPLCVCVCVLFVPCCVWKSEDSLQESVLWVLRIELKCLGLVAGTLYPLAHLRAWVKCNFKSATDKNIWTQLAVSTYYSED